MADVGKETTEPGSGERSFARQPIFDDRHQVFVNELLCRDVGSPAAHGVASSFRATTSASRAPSPCAPSPHGPWRDPRLSLRVLRGVNSAGFGLRREVHSIREALLLLGLHQVRKWASVWALAGVNGGSPELVSLTVLRLLRAAGRPDERLRRRRRVLPARPVPAARRRDRLLDGRGREGTAAHSGHALRAAGRQERDAVRPGRGHHARARRLGRRDGGPASACMPKISPRPITRRCHGRGR